MFWNLWPSLRWNASTLLSYSCNSFCVGVAWNHLTQSLSKPQWFSGISTSIEKKKLVQRKATILFFWKNTKSNALTQPNWTKWKRFCAIVLFEKYTIYIVSVCSWIMLYGKKNQNSLQVQNGTCVNYIALWLRSLLLGYTEKKVEAPPTTLIVQNILSK